MQQNYNYPYGYNNSQQKPEKIKLAIKLLYISLIITFVHGVINLFQIKDGNTMIFSLLIFIFVLGMELVLIYFITKANNTARIIYTILMAVGTLFLLPALYYFSIPEIIYNIGFVGLNIFIIVLLFHPTSSNWFRMGRFNY